MREQLEVMLIAMLVPLFPLVSAYVTILLNNLIAKAKKEAELVDLAQLNFYLDLADKTIKEAVNRVQQTLVDDLKKNGLFTEDKKIEALNTAKDIVLELLNENSKLALEQAHKDYLQYIENKIEDLIKDSKM